MVVTIDRGMLDHHFQDRRNGEDIADAMALDQPERLVNIEAFRRKQDRRNAARGLHELVDARAMRKRRDHQRGVILGGAGHEVGEVIGDHKGHLAVGQYRRFGSSCRARSEEEPAGIVVLNSRVLDLCARMRSENLIYGFLAECTLAYPPNERERRARRLHGRGMLREIAMTKERLGARGRG